MSKANILVVEDDPLQRKLIKENLEQETYTVFESASGKEALSMIDDHPIDIAIVDYKLDGETGISVIHDILEKNPLITPIMVTAFGNIENAVEAIKKGAYDYIVIQLKELCLLLIKDGRSCTPNLKSFKE
jgi:DNA-binding NtrC family response regulator